MVYPNQGRGDPAPFETRLVGAMLQKRMKWFLLSTFQAGRPVKSGDEILMEIGNEIELQAICRLARRMGASPPRPRLFRRCRDNFGGLQPRPSGPNRQSTAGCGGPTVRSNQPSTD